MKSRNMVLSKLLVAEAKNRVESPKTDEEKFERETQKLFCWIMSRLLWEMDASLDNSQRGYTLTLKETYNSGKFVTLSHGRVSEYSCHYIIGDDFYNVLSKMVEIFNSFGNNYSAKYFPRNQDVGAELIIHLTV